MKFTFLSLLAGLSLCASFNLQAQTVTATFQPGPCVGKDAHVWTLDGNCIPSGYTTTPADLNFGDTSELSALDWTWSSGGCGSGTHRSLIAFTELASIPPGATIVSATLELFGVPTSLISHGNSYYPGSPYPNTNPTQLHLVTGAWSESAVTWNTQPTFNATPLFTIPTSTSRYSYNYVNSSPALVAQVQNWVNFPSSNHGLLMKLVTEVHYRSMVFASSDHPDPNLRPKLTVVYSNPCNANFSFSSSSINAYQYTFTAADPTGTNTWSISPAGGATPPTGSGSSFITTFSGPGTFMVTLTHTSTSGVTCKRSIYLCVSQNSVSTTAATMPSEALLAPERKINVTPNPVTASCDVHYQALETGTVNINVFDLFGKKVYEQKSAVQEGANKLQLPTQNLAAGTYIIQLNDQGQTFNERIVKQ